MIDDNKLFKENGVDRLFNIFNNTYVFVFFVIVLYPIIYVVSASFSSPAALVSGKVWLLPVEPSLAGYKAVFAEKNIWTGYANSIFYTVIGTIVNVVVTIAAAYPLSRKDFYGRNVIMVLFTITMIFSAGIIPHYLVVKGFGLIDSRLALIIPSAMSVYNLIITRTFFSTNISDELMDAGKIDGCSNFKFLVSIVLPLSGAIISVITLFYAVGHWNSFFDALLYLNSKNKYPLQIFLREILTMNASTDITVEITDGNMRLYLAELLKYSLIVLSSLPLIVVYPFVQKYFVKGIMVGSVKG